VENVTEGKARYDWPVQVNRLLLEGGFSLIVSIGQVVPHEVIGMANHTKNIFVGTGGKEAIDKSHFAGAAYGMERMMGRIDTPVRALFDEGFKRYGDRMPPVLYALTVVGTKSDGSSELRGFYAGFGRECFEKAAALSRQVNVEILDEPIKKAVVYLEPEEFRTTWLGNKSIYRTRMAMADGGELLILAPALERFGEDLEVDRVIRKFGYRQSSAILEKTENEKELKENLSVAAHLIHGSSEGRFTVRYCPGPGVSRTEIESAGYEWGSLDEAMTRYNVKNLKAGWNTHSDGERFFYVPNPALGLWASKSKF
jgi:nickel-dependent lactate racemase